LGCAQLGKAQEKRAPDTNSSNRLPVRWPIRAQFHIAASRRAVTVSSPAHRSQTQRNAAHIQSHATSSQKRA
jgi:hypothetical protein